MTKATKAPTTEETYGILQAIRIIFTKVTNVVVITARTTEKTIKLVENEVDQLDQTQAIRLKRLQDSAA